MKKYLSKIIGLVAIAALGIGVTVSVNTKSSKVVAEQHINNFDSYTYSGDYYDDIDFDAAGGMNGALRTSLTTLIRPAGFYTYGSSGETHLSTQLQYADEDPTNSNNMVYFYTRDSVTKNAASTWNREHVWCQSLSNNNWGESEGGTDILHLRPTYNNVNSSRSNDPYADLNKAYPKYFDTDTLKVTNNSSKMLFGYSDGTWFEPLDAVKGDVARIIMYTWTTYTGWVGNKTYNPLNILSVIESYDTLLRWHTLDKPDVLEGNRNNYCETSLQANRNPFVDHPELAWRIFGDEASENVKNACIEAYPYNGGSPIEATGMTLNTTSTSLTVGSTLQLTASLQPNGATGDITWSSSNTNVALVNSSGLVTAVSEGNAVITARVSNSVYATCSVTVTQGEASGYLKIASYNFNDGNVSNSEYTSNEGLLARFTSCAVSGNDLSDIVTNVSNMTKVYPGYANYYNFGLKLGTGSANGSFTVSLDQNVTRVVVKTVGWATDDTLTVGDADAQTPGVAYTADNPIKTLTYDITPSSSVTFLYQKRGFIQSIDFYKQNITGPETYLNYMTSVKGLFGHEVAEGETVQRSVRFSELGFTNAQVISSINVDSNVTINASKASGATNPAYYDSGTNLRIYSNNTLTFTSLINITRIEFSFSSGYANGLSASAGTLSNGVWTGSAASITFTNAGGSQVRITQVNITYGERTFEVDSVFMRFGAIIAKADWTAINSSWPISDYGVMLTKQETLEDTYHVSSIEEAYEGSNALTVLHKGSGDTPVAQDENNYAFTVKYNITQLANYDVTYCAAPFIVANNHYYFLEEMRCSVCSLAGYCLSHSDCSNLSNEALTLLGGN